MSCFPSKKGLISFYTNCLYEFKITYLTFLAIRFSLHTILQYAVFTLQLLTQFFLRRQITFILR